MSNSISENVTWSATGQRPPIRQMVIVALGTWLGIVLMLAAAGTFVDPPGRPPLSVFTGAMLPLMLFAIAWRTSRAFREFLLMLDIHWVVAVQAWRYAGFGFIELYTLHVLPGLFAWPAGLGDMAIGIAATFWVATLVKNPDAIASPGFRLWNALGILDFVIAFTTATLSAMLIVSDSVPSMAPMPHLPLILIPTFMVPLFTMLHIVALMQSRQARAAMQAVA
jgi:hypothetical protein